jgi:hypothetical protein
MATFDDKVLKAYPEIAKRPRDLHFALTIR